MPGYLHHIQWSVASLQETSHKLRTEYGMREVAGREDRLTGRREVVLQSGLVTFLLSETREEVVVEDQTGYPWLSSGRRGGERQTDSVFNICLEVGDVRESYERMTGAGSLSISAPRDLRTEEGEVTVAVVSSPCRQVVHSLVNTAGYSGTFLPGFSPLQDSQGEEGQEEVGDLLTHIDHITLVCQPGDSRTILDWYSNTCGMQPFTLSQEEVPGEGTDFEEVGLKLNVSSWVTEWLCREEGVTWDPSQDNVKNFKLVLAEPLPGLEDSHVNSFLRDNGGPGVQHIGLATLNMTETITTLARRGAVFRKPPHTYYSLPGKQEEILTTGQDLDTFKLHGILIDREPTEPSKTPAFLLGDEEEQEETNNYLLQIFSYPLFQADTFFLEIIQRHNSIGFGGGNIRALAQSVIEAKRERKMELVSSLTAKSERIIVKSCSQQDLQPSQLQLSRTLRRANTVQSGLNIVMSH